MMETVVYELEEVEEIVARDVFILDGLRMSKEEQRNKIFDMLEAKGYDLGDRSKLEIGYDGAESFEDGMYTTFEVRRKVTKEVPYKVKRDEIYEGEFILDGLRMSEEQQREKIFDMMRRDGIEVTDPEELEIGYDGAESFEDGMFTRFGVFRVTKERITEEEAKKIGAVSDEHEHTSDLDELKALREKLGSVEVSVNQDDLEKIDELTKSLETSSSAADAMTDDFRKELELIDSHIKELRKTIKETEKEYEDTFRALCEMTERQKESFESLDLLTDEELRNLMEQYSLEKLLESEKVLKIEKELKLEKKQLTSFMRRKNKVERNILKAEALDLSVAEYSEITSALNKRKIVNEILSRKGLDEIISKKAAERTKEEKALLKSAKEEIEKEIAMLQNSTDGMSVLEAIEALYSIDTKMLLAKKSRKVKVKKQDLENIKQNVLLLPQKVANDGAVMNYVAGKAPEDMVAAISSNESEPEREEIFSGTLILDNVQQTPEERIREMMRTAGVEVGDDEIEIGYDGASDNDGLSETQTTSFVVYRKKKKKDLPAVVEEPQDVSTDSKDDSLEREEIFSGTLILDNVQQTPEERIREMMRTAGVEVGDDEIEIGYDGASDNDGLSETQTTSFVVYRKKKKIDFPSVEGVTLDKELYDMVSEAGGFCQYHQFLPMAKSDNRLESSNRLDNDVKTGDENLEWAYSDSGVVYEFDRGVLMYSKTGVEHLEIISEDDMYTHHSDLMYRIAKDEFNDAIVDEYTPMDNARLANEKGMTVLMFEGNIVQIYLPENPPKEVLEGIKRQLEPRKNFTIASAINGKILLKVDDPLPDVWTYDEYIGYLNKRIAEFDITHNDTLERIVIYHDLDNNKKYVKKPVLDRFNVETQGKEVRIDGTVCYELGDEDYQFIIGNADNDSSPYHVEEEEKHLGKKITPTDDTLERIVIYHDLDNNKRYAKKPVFRRFNAEQQGEEVKIDNSACYELDDEDYQLIIGNANNDYSPYYVDEKEIHLGKKIIPIDDTLERIVIYHDLDNNKRYAKKPVFRRFNAEQQGEEVKIDNSACYELNDEDYQFIIGNANNDYSPYYVDEKEKHLGKKIIPTDDTLERIVIYVDLDDNGKRYAKNYVFTRFNAQKQGDGVKIKNALCYQLTDEDAEYIIGNADNDYSPYKVEIVPVNLKKKLDPKQEHDKITLFRDLNDNGQIYASEEILRRFGITPSGSARTIEGSPCYKIDEDIDGKINGLAKESNPVVDVNYKDVHLRKKKTPVREVKTETITLFRDVNDNGQIYASEAVLRRFGITPSGDFEAINGLNCYKISREADALINHIAKESKDPKITVKYVDVKLKKKSDNPVYRPHVETILDKLTTGLDIHAKDCKRYQASNIKVAKSFKDELQSGNIWYNIVHFVPSLAKIPFMLFRKLSGRLMTTKRAKDAMQELEERLDELSEEELEVLFEEYKGSQLKTDMNNQINGLILQRLRRFGLEKVSVLNDTIRDNYANLFSLLGQIRAIEEQLNNEQIDENTRASLVERRAQLIEYASGFVKRILIARKDANNLLSGGVHGLEEDFKAVSTKLSYVGMRFAKKNDFDNELQHALGQYGEGLNTAISTGDDEAIVSNFMGLESCYYDNTEIARSVFGNRSVGSKYYSPLAEQFDYRDDPFIRDIFTTVALTSAAVSAVNAIRVHQIESQELLRQQQQEAHNVNSSNDTVMDYVHQTGQQIEGHRGTFQEGMQAQAQQDVLSSANTIERAELDMHNWSFGDSYRAADAQGHDFYNAFGDNVTSQIGDITTRYGNGTITSAQALQEMADVANGAQTTLSAVSGECLDILRTYAQSHPQFDLSAVQESMEYIAAHPDAIANMNQGMVDVTNLAGGLSGLSATHVTALSSLPSDMLSTLVCAASAAGLALNISKTMEHKYGRHRYGNEVTDMMDEYVNGYNDEDEDELEEEAETTHHR